ncbi:dihydroneopterin aldolase [Agrilactobacillus yilanensis]|uniref:7,8-dihydroneopterin aldolase n=1 Tax=Agrilactobacillus yilanensis TaxID=2485997 RepID=A0ABW4J6B9_9LACO|nr:dihydroneopterin aldolase [Agrilactobacillus yilanensis]
MLTIRLNNLRFHGHIGVYTEEKKIGQDLQLDLIIQTPINHNEIHDDLTKTLSYGDVYRQVAQIVTDSRVDLVEALAHDIIVGLRAEFSEKISQITVRIRKLNTPINGVMDNVEIEVTD